MNEQDETLRREWETELMRQRVHGEIWTADDMRLWAERKKELAI